MGALLLYLLMQGSGGDAEASTFTIFRGFERLGAPATLQKLNQPMTLERFPVSSNG